MTTLQKLETGLPNLGATCWFNALMQCLRYSRKWENPEISSDPFTHQFLTFMNEFKDPRPFLFEFNKKFPNWEGLPNDAQEAFLLILDVLEKTIGLKDFTGEITQTITYPTGTSVTKWPFTIYNFDKDLTLTDYKDSEGIIHRVAIQQNEITKMPKILVCSTEKLLDGDLFALIPWCWGHYISFVKSGNETWYMFDDESVTSASPNLDQKYYLAFYK